MSDIVEILGEKKFNGSKNETLKVQIKLDAPIEQMVESNLFYDVNQDNVYLNEKASCNNYRIYGKISPIINNNFTTSNLISIKPSAKQIEITKDIWDIVVLVPVKSLTNDYGYRKLTIPDQAEYDFENGVPVLKLLSKVINGKPCVGFNSYLGHNLNVNDQVYITSLDKNLESGIYRVLQVSGNKFYINATIPELDTINPQEFTLRLENSVAQNNFGNVQAEILTTEPGNITIGDALDNNLIVSETVVNELANDIFKTLNQPRVNPYKLMKSKYFYKKVIENEVMDYYVKELEVVSIINDFDDCAFSVTAFNENIKTFTTPDQINITGIVNNLGYPVSELYVGLIKKGGNSTDLYGNVEANFSQLIKYTEDNTGLQVITQKQTGSNRDQVYLGQRFLYGLMEFDKGLITETIVSPINHRFIYNDILFYYQPFYSLKIRALSQYIETSDLAITAPQYATYDPRREKYIWRNILDVGFFEENNVGIELQYLNNCFYVFSDIVFTIKNDKSVKYEYNKNVFDTLDNIETTNINDILKDVVDQSIDINEPFKKYSKGNC